ncbi:MAG: 50S ribosomal protein L6 [Patescibacteria group bacterium]|nr:MAG: 50S ribosomal protein L6 [Patescibacteria group bacterium]
MSRIGKQQIIIPEKTQVVKDGKTFIVKGPLGEISRSFLATIDIMVGDKEVTLAPTDDSKFANALWGTYASHIKNMIEGVNKPFEKKLVVEGVGFKVEMSGDELVLKLGFSHKIHIAVPKELSVSIEKNKITVSGINKEIVGQFAARIRAFKKPEPYKGKGIRYIDEVVRRKQGKKSA